MKSKKWIKALIEAVVFVMIMMCIAIPTNIMRHFHTIYR